MEPATAVVVLGFHHGSLGISRSLGRLGVPVYGVDDDQAQPAMASRYVKERLRWNFQEAPAGETVAWLLALGRRLGKPLRVATTDATALLVAEHAGALAECFRFHRNAPELIRSFSDKKSLFFLAQRHGIPTPAAAFPSSIADVRHYAENGVFPVMLKGIDGTRLETRTGKKMVIVGSAEELPLGI